MNTKTPAAMTDLLALMRTLRGPGGCPWDREQTFATVAPYTLEEAYEVADAIQGGEPDKLREELGDLLFQIVFHARMAEECGWFDFEAVARGIHDKLVRRHPHVFAPAAIAAAGGGTDDRPRTSTAVLTGWEHTKAQEREARAAAAGKGPAGVLDDVPLALPALTRACKLSKRAARVGFDWSDPADVRAKVDEELAELDEALAACAGGPPSAHAVEELGDVLFAIVNWARHVGVDPETALRGTNAKFERRFGFMEGLARARGLELAALSLPQWEELWQEAKAAERDRHRL